MRLGGRSGVLERRRSGFDGGDRRVVAGMSLVAVWGFTCRVSLSVSLLAVVDAAVLSKALAVDVSVAVAVAVATAMAMAVAVLVEKR